MSIFLIWDSHAFISSPICLLVKTKFSLIKFWMVILEKIFSFWSRFRLSNKRDREMVIFFSDTKFIILVMSSTLTPSCKYSSGIKVLSALDLLALPFNLLRLPFVILVLTFSMSDKWKKYLLSSVYVCRWPHLTQFLTVAVEIPKNEAAFLRSMTFFALIDAVNSCMFILWFYASIISLFPL